jgi:acyl-CoA reductase-like NAD-dependent aldehyde dehydrogenase
MGKILSEAEAEVEKCAHEADWYAEHGPKIMADEPAPTGTVNAYVSYLPLGPILAIMPWNFPIWQLTRMAIPTMLARNPQGPKSSFDPSEPDQPKKVHRGGRSFARTNTAHAILWPRVQR